MNQLFNKYIIGLVFILSVVLIPTYKTEAVSVTDNSPFTFTASLDKTSVYVGDVNIKASMSVQWNNSWNIQYIYPTSVNELFPYRRYYMVTKDWFDTCGSTAGCSSGISATAASNAKNGNLNEGWLPYKSINKTDMSIDIRNIDFNNFQVAVNGDVPLSASDVTIQKLDSTTNTYSKASFPITDISKLPAGHYNAIFKAYPYIYVMEEGCKDKWYTGVFGATPTVASSSDVCGWTGLGAINRTTYKKIWPMYITIPFTVSTPPTPDPIPSGSISITSCSVPLNASTCTASLNWTTANLNADSGTSIKVFNMQGSATNSGVYVGSGQTGTNVPVTVSYNSPNTYLLENDIFTSGLKSMLFDTAYFTASCAKGLVWNDTSKSCAYTNATVNVTVNPYVDASQKSASIIKGDSVTLRWTSINAASCSCLDSYGKDCFAKGSYSNSTTGYNYAGYIGDTKNGETPPITLDKSTKFYITCK